VYTAPTETNCMSCANSWLWGTSNPSESHHVVIDIGPGTFEPFICPKAPTGSAANGHVVVRGAGRDATFLKSTATTGRAGIHVNSCEDLVFSNLHAEGSSFGVLWQNGGEATWTSVDMVATFNVPASDPRENYAAGWYDADAPTTTGEESTHFLHDCRASATTAVQGITLATGYLSEAAESYFFGGSISVGPSSQTTTNGVYGVYLHSGTAGAEFKAFDTQISAKNEVGGSVTGVFAGDGTHALVQGASVLVRGASAAGFGGDILFVDTAVDAHP
jgi:hypothetical protein